jgi:hypothetical protein
MGNVNVISGIIEDEELARLSSMNINLCPYCGRNSVMTLESAQWCYGERRISSDEWKDTIAIGCSVCEASGPHCDNREQAILAWNKFTEKS